MNYRIYDDQIKQTKGKELRMTGTIEGFRVYGCNHSDIIDLMWSDVKLALSVEDISLLSHLLTFELDVEMPSPRRIQVSQTGELIFVYVDNMTFRLTGQQTLELVNIFNRYIEYIETNPVDQDGWWGVDAYIDADTWRFISHPVSQPAETTNWIKEGF